MESARARGLFWVIGQFVLIAIIAGATLLDPFKQSASTILHIIAGLCISSGVTCVILSFRQLGRSLTAFPKPLTTGALVTHGLYSIVRHPIYTGLLLGCVGMSIFAASPIAIASTIVLSLWLNAKANYEETWLVRQYPEYTDYRTHTKKFIPFVW